MFRKGKKEKAPKKPKIKGTKREKQLYRQYEEGRVLQVNNKKDNKEYFESLSKKDG